MKSLTPLAIALSLAPACNLVLEDSPGLLVEVEVLSPFDSEAERARWSELRLSLQEVALLPCLPVLGAEANARAASHGVSSSTRIIAHRWLDLLQDPIAEPFILIGDGADACAVRLTFGGHASGSETDRLSLIAEREGEGGAPFTARTTRAFDIRIPIDPTLREPLIVTVELRPERWLEAMGEATTESERGQAMADACATTTTWQMTP